MYSHLSNQCSSRPESILLVCYYDPVGISTVPETVSFMQSCSRFSLTVFNLFEHGKNDEGLGFPPRLNLNSFDGLVIHNSVSYNVDNLRSLDRYLGQKIKDYSGIKVLMKQDENFKFREMAEYMGEVKFDIVFTCLPPEALTVIYPKTVVGSPIFSRMLTGYVTPTLRNVESNIENRSIDIGYRGSIQPLSFGRLAYEKRKIGDEVLKYSKGRELTVDISSRWEDRLGSNAWIHFLSDCKATLGVESGASIFDLNGQLSSRCKTAEKKYGPYKDDGEYAEKYLAELADIEGKINYNQISPRHFEAAATNTLQIMYPGEYSGIFYPGVHYVELERDHSNIDQVVALLKSESDRSKIVKRAHEEIIQNTDFWIETFVSRFDALLERVLAKKQSLTRPTIVVGRKQKNVLLICAHKPSIDPRIAWVSEGAPENLKITQVGVIPSNSTDSRVIRDDDGGLILSEPLTKFTQAMYHSWLSMVKSNAAGLAALSEISFISNCLTIDDSLFCELFGAPIENARIDSFKWYLRYLLNTTATLVSQIKRMRGYSAIIATDLDTLIAALVVKGFSNVPIVYDAHEYWPEADVSSLEFETNFWVALEGRLLQHVDYCQTVSPGLAKIMSEHYGRKFHVVPNCEPISSSLNHLGPIRKPDGKCYFIFQGNFAPKRGLDLLIDAWHLTDSRAILLLRGPDNEHKFDLIDRAKQKGLYGKRIKFLSPVSESELVSAAQNGDVGLVPYTPFGANYANCCPNKTSQYMAAGLPILANNTSFVREIVEDSRSGIVTDFSRAQNVANTVSWFVENQQQRMEMGENSAAYFNNTFNWNQVSKSMYSEITRLVTGASAKPLRIFPLQVERMMYLNQEGQLEIRGEIQAEVQPQLKLTPSAPIESRPKLTMLQRIWRILPVSFRYRFGARILRRLRSIVR